MSAITHSISCSSKWRAGESLISKPGFLGQVGVRASLPHRPLGLCSVPTRRKVADTIPLLRMGLSPLAGHVLFWPCPIPRVGHTLGAQLVGSPALGRRQQCLVRTWKEGHHGWGLSSSESFEDFFASLENEHLWTSISSLFYSITNCLQSFWTFSSTISKCKYSWPKQKAMSE